MHILKAGGLYFVLVFATGWILGPVRELWVIPGLGRIAGHLLEAPLMLMAMVAAAWWTARRLAVPHALPARLAMGLVALGLLLVAEIGGVLWVRHLSIPDYVASFGSVPGGVSLLLFFLFAMMPALLGRR